MEKKITKFESLFSEELYLEVKEYVDDLFKTKSTLFTTNLFWDRDLKNTSTMIARYDFEKNDIEIYKKIKTEIEKRIPYYVNTCVLHVLPNLSYITWHSDPHYKAALTVYLNENWDNDWGGFLMYEEDNIIKAIKPEKNLAILQENHISHCVTTVNIGADYRLSLQFFLDNKKNIL